MYRLLLGNRIAARKDGRIRQLPADRGIVREWPSRDPFSIRHGRYIVDSMTSRLLRSNTGFARTLAPVKRARGRRVLLAILIVLMAAGPLPRAAVAIASVVAPRAILVVLCPMHVAAQHSAMVESAVEEHSAGHGGHIAPAIDSAGSIPPLACDCSTGCYLTAAEVPAPAPVDARITRAPLPSEGSAVKGTTPAPLPRPPRRQPV